jgi:hypothetical protein
MPLIRCCSQNCDKILSGKKNKPMYVHKLVVFGKIWLKLLSQINYNFLQKIITVRRAAKKFLKIKIFLKNKTTFAVKFFNNGKNISD